MLLLLPWSCWQWKLNNNRQKKVNGVLYSLRSAVYTNQHCHNSKYVFILLKNENKFMKFSVHPHSVYALVRRAREYRTINTQKFSINEEDLWKIFILLLSSFFYVHIVTWHVCLCGIYNIFLRLINIDNDLLAGYTFT